MRHFAHYTLILCTLLIAYAPAAPLVPAHAAAPAFDPTSEPMTNITGTLTYDGLERHYRLHLPPTPDANSIDSASDPIPLVVALHDEASSGLTLALLTDLNSAADAAGYAIVYPDAHGYNWGEDTSLPEDEQIDDVGFITALIDTLAAEHNIDPDRVYLTGYRNGGLMAYRLACETPELFASVAVVGPLLWGYQLESCPAESTAPVNLLIVHGTADPMYWDETRTFTTLFSNKTYTLIGLDDTLAFWLERNTCDPDSLRSVNGVMNTRAYTCAEDTRLALYRVLDGRQIWTRTGDYTLNPFGIDATEMVMAWFAGDATWAQEQPSFTDQARTYTVFVPSSYDPAEPMPVTMVLHGRFGSGGGTAQWTDMNRIAEENGFIAVYPNGLVNPDAQIWYDTGWNYYRGTPYDSGEGADDVEFLANVLDDLALDLNIDPARVYVVGISNGGFMVHHLACVDPARYAAFADVMGSGYPGMETQCDHDVPVSVLMIHGTADDNITWRGNTTQANGQQFYVTYPIEGTISYWGTKAGCDLENFNVEEVEPTGESPNSTVTILSFDCPDDVEIILYGVIGGGHQWPGVAEDSDDAVENLINMDINAGEEIWDFFSRHAR
ncbi:MAG: hypothetical protein JXA10_17965 [Anaerolineae bacterium]|nr:hypothetical protein [Anaerolineae bacterium]